MDCRGATDVAALGHFATENQNIFVEGNAADIFHCAPVVFSNCDLVVLTKWIGQTESLFKVSKALLSDFKDVFSVDILEE